MPDKQVLETLQILHNPALLQFNLKKIVTIDPGEALKDTCFLLYDDLEGHPLKTLNPPSGMGGQIYHNSVKIGHQKTLPAKI